MSTTQTALALVNTAANLSQRRGQWWSPVSWFVVSPDEARGKVDQVLRYRDALGQAVTTSPAAAMRDPAWVARWNVHAIGLQSWAMQSREALSGVGPESLDAPRIAAEGNEKLRELRGWYDQARDQGIATGEPPPDLVDLGLLEVRRPTLYVAGGLVLVGLGAAAYVKARGVRVRLPWSSSSRKRRNR